MNLFILGFIGPWQIAIVVLVIVLLFGGKKIPELMKGLGQGLKEFKNATKDKEKEKELDSKADSETTEN